MSSTKQILLAVLLYQFVFLKIVSGETQCGNAQPRPRSLIRPSRLLDQHFGLVLDPDDFFEPLLLPRWLSSPTGYLRPWRSDASRGDSGSTVSYDKDKFQANLDVQQFSPEEITVKLTDDDNTITIEGKHEEKQDEHGYISRHFIRKYTLPKNSDKSRIESKLSSDGVLTVSAPRLSEQIDHKEIPIQQTGEPAKRIENKKDDSKEQHVDL